MHTHRARQNWFLCFSPDGIVTRLEAVNLIRKHIAKGAPRFALFTGLTDEQIRAKLPTAWLREHQQADMFRDATAAVANDDTYRAEPVTASPVSGTDVTQRNGRLTGWYLVKKAFMALFDPH